MYGREATLLDTRAKVLETAGHRVRTASSLERLQRLLTIDPPDLLLLCHTLSMEECGRAIALTIPWPRTISLALTTGQRGCHAQMLGAVLDTMDGPAKLISTVGKLVETASLAHTHLY